MYIIENEAHKNLSKVKRPDGGTSFTLDYSGTAVGTLCEEHK
jgi:hypothetical protein